MRCVFCGRESQAIRPSKRYCNNVCRQADYRRRHQSTRESVTELKLQLAQTRQELEHARQRIAELERLVTTSPSHPRKRNVTVQPVEMWSFIHTHLPVYDPAIEQMVTETVRDRKLVKNADDVYLLDAREQRVFWERFNSVQGWQECDACPHEYKDTTPARKRPDFDLSAKETGLPEGCILAVDFAKIHGVPDSTLRHHITKGINKEKADVSRRARAGRPNQQESYLTPEQQNALLDYWRRHGVKFTQGHV